MQLLTDQATDTADSGARETSSVTCFNSSAVSKRFFFSDSTTKQKENAAGDTILQRSYKLVSRRTVLL